MNGTLVYSLIQRTEGADDLTHNFGHSYIVFVKKLHG